MKPIQTGDQAPAFTAQAHNGQQVSLADFQGKSVVVLYSTRKTTRRSAPRKPARSGTPTRISSGRVRWSSESAPTRWIAIKPSPAAIVCPSCCWPTRAARSGRRSACPRHWACCQDGSRTSSTETVSCATCSTRNFRPTDTWQRRWKSSPSWPRTIKAGRTGHAGRQGAWTSRRLGYVPVRPKEMEPLDQMNGDPQSQRDPQLRADALACEQMNFGQVDRAPKMP